MYIRIDYLIILFSFFFFETAFASRARVDALQNKNHVIDTESLFQFPTRVSEINPFLSVESGQTAPANLSQGAFASGLVAVDTKTALAMSLGRQDNMASSQRIFYNQLFTESFDLSQSPINLIWSHKDKGQSFAFGLFYSNYNDKLTEATETTQTILLGYRTGFLSLSLTMGLLNTVQTAAAKYLNIYDAASFSALYEIDTLVLSASIENFTAQQKNVGIDQNAIEHQNIRLAFSDRTDLNQAFFFYRLDILINSTKYKALGNKERENQMPFTFGIESEYNNWLTLRSSIKQTMLISQFENKPATANNTQAAFGLGLKFNQMTLDGTLSGLIGSTQSGTLNGNQFLSEVALTSVF
jgi:hypothetical protein